MSTLNKDCFGLIFSHLPLKEAVQNMLLCRATACLYNDNGFWRQYCLSRYHIDTTSREMKKRPGTTPLAIVIEAEEMVQALWSQRLYPPLRMLPYVFSLHPKKREDCLRIMKNNQRAVNHISSLTPTMWCVPDKEIAIVQLCPNIPQLELLLCPLNVCRTFHLGSPSSTIHETATNLRRILKAVTIPTWYLTESGPVQLPIDIDRCITLTPQINVLGDEFSTMVRNQLWILVHQTCMQYLP